MWDRKWTIGVCLSVVIGVSAFLIPSRSGVHEDALRFDCKNHLKQIGIALHAYHDKYGTFPPAFVADAFGRPVHSWRVLILPFLEHPELYEKYDFEEPWDGPNNSKLTDEAPEVYRCSGFDHKLRKSKQSDPRLRQLTNYVGVCSPQTLFPDTTFARRFSKGLTASLQLRDIIDGKENTIAIAETHAHAVRWMQPDDASPDELFQELQSPAPEPSTYGRHFPPYHRQFLFADGSVRKIGQQIDADTFRALCTIGGGETISDY